MDPCGVRSEVFVRGDIENILRAVERANEALAAQLPAGEAASYRAGFSAALRAVAAGFGISLDPPPATPVTLLSLPGAGPSPPGN